MPVREADLDEWMSRLARGDRAAFEPLYLALRPRAFRLARMRVGPGNADDLAQAALLNVFARASEFEPGRSCLPWFYAIVSNEIRADRRRQSRITDDASLEERALDEEDAEAQMIRRELERSLDLAIESLDHDSTNAICALLDRAPPPNVAPATFRKRVSRAYAKLRLLLGGHDVR